MAETIDIPVPGGTTPPQPKEGKSMPMDTSTIGDSLGLVAVTQAQGHAFIMEQGRVGLLEGKVGYREGLTHRIIGESGGGQARAQLPGQKGGVPTA